jgi:predicted RNase H-like HicB family nuclease
VAVAVIDLSSYSSVEYNAAMTFLVAIHKDPGSSYGVCVPDLPGCITAGDTIEEALIMAKEAIELYLEGMLDDGRELPDPTSDIDQLRANPDYADAIWGAVRVDLDWRRSSTAAA